MRLDFYALSVWNPHPTMGMKCNRLQINSMQRCICMTYMNQIREYRIRLISESSITKNKYHFFFVIENSEMVINLYILNDS